jgi:hypothetical protein
MKVGGVYECLKRKENGADVVVLFFSTVFGARQSQVQLLADTSCVLCF